MTNQHINRQLGDYVIFSTEKNRPPFFVRMAGDEEVMSTHKTVTEAVKQIMIHQSADKRRQRKA